MQQYIIHIDMDAFFASVEQNDRPELKGLPVIVGHGHRGVVCAASYEARKFGVHSAMPTGRARQLCPQGVFVTPNHRRYSQVSKQVMAVFGSFSPLVEQASIDEAYLDGSGLEKLFGPPREVGLKIKEAVLAATGLTCSVGMAPVKFLAKIASGLQKPDGLTIIYPEEVQAFLDNLPVKQIPGVGPRTAEILALLGIKTAGDVRAVPQAILQARIGKAGEMIWRRAHGEDSSKVVAGLVPKSEGRENTLLEDTTDRDFLKTYLLEQCERVSAGVRRLNTCGRTVTLKVKFSNFKQITRSHTLDLPTNSTRIMFATACALLDRLDLNLPVRLIGVSLSGFVWQEKQTASLRSALLPGLANLLPDAEKALPEAKGAAKPLSLPNLDLKKEGRLERAIDKVRERYGRESLKRAALLRAADAEDDKYDARDEAKHHDTGKTEEGGGQ